MNTSTNNTLLSTNEGKIVGCFTFIYSLIGLSLSLLILWSLIKTKRAKMNTFYILLINQILADGLCFVFYIFYVAPCEYWLIKVTGNAKIFFGQLYGYIYMINLLSTFAISVHRLIIIFNLAPKSTTPQMVPWFVVAALWIMTVPAKVADYTLTGCLAELSFDYYSLVVRCLRRKGVLSTSAIMVYGCVHLMGVFYLAAMLKMKWNYRHIVSSEIEHLARKDQLRAFCQTAGIWFSVFVNAVAFNFLHITDPLLNGMITPVLVLLPPYASSFIVFVFDSETRVFIAKKTSRMLQKKPTTVRPQTLPS